MGKILPLPGRMAYLVIDDDGFRSYSLQIQEESVRAVETGDVIRIQKAELPFNMVCVGEIGFYQKMRSKLNRT